MRDVRPRNAAVLSCLCCMTLLGVTEAQAQPSQSTTATVVPKLVRFTGSFRPANGLPAQPVESVTLSVYSDQNGGNALWQEIQNVSLDADGHYSVLMGATRDDGMPLDLFTSAEPRWLGIQFNRPGEAEQPRVRLASVPYALKASDADTLAGKPASAYMLATVPSAPNSASAGPSTSASTTITTPLKPRVNAGTAGYIGMFTDPTDLGNSIMYEGASGNVGVGTASPSALLQVGGASANDFSGTSAMGVLQRSSDTVALSVRRIGADPVQQFCVQGVVCNYIQLDSSGALWFGGYSAPSMAVSLAGNVGIGTATPGSKLDVAGDVNLSGTLRYQGSPILQVPGGLSSNNLAVGPGALASNATGYENTASGSHALFSNTTGNYNAATGFYALSSNAVGTANTADGYLALYSNNTGNYNTASGTTALYNNTSGYSDTAVGYNALSNNSIGDFNIAIGYLAAINVSGGNSDNIHIGSQGSANDSGTIRIGTPGTQSSFFAAGVRGVTTGNNNAIPVMIDSNGQLGTISSSRRFKEDIKDMGSASHDLMRLRPVIFRYKTPFADGSKPIQYGLIAEEVAEIYPDLVAHSADGQIETVKYQVLDSMLLNEVQRQQDQIRSLEQRLAKLEAALNADSLKTGSIALTTDSLQPIR